MADQNLNPVVALDNLEYMGFVPFGVATAFLMSFGAPFLARGHSRLQKNDAIRIVFAEEINCVPRGNTASDDM